MVPLVVAVELAGERIVTGDVVSMNAVAVVVVVIGVVMISTHAMIPTVTYI